MKFRIAIILILPCLAPAGFATAILAQDGDRSSKQGASEQPGGQEAASDQLSGPVRRISGETRATAPSSDSLDLPRTISLLFGDQGIRVIEGTDTSSAVTVERSFNGEVLSIGGQPPELASATRAISGNTSLGESLSIAAPPVGLDQLLGQVVFRGESLLTPAPGSRLLSGQVTFRRVSRGGEPLEQATIDLRSGSRAVARFDLPAGVAQLAWRQITGLPESVRTGLPAGEYNLVVNGQPAGSFKVETPEIVEWILEPVYKFAEAAGTDSATASIFHIETLLSQRDEEGRPLPYLCDALDKVEAMEASSAYAIGRRSRVVAILGGDAEPIPSSSLVGIREIDDLRRLIEEGRWRDARVSAEELSVSDDERTAKLAKLYQAVISGESSADSVHSTDNTRLMFQEAIREIGETNAADAFRAHNNYANYLAGKAHSRVYNYAFHSAASLDSPLGTALWCWGQAKAEYERSEEIGGEMPEADRAALALNRARLYLTMSDLASNLGASGSQFEALVTHANKLAEELASTASKLQGADAMTRAAAAEALAHLAYRSGDADEAKRWSAEAIAGYEAVGSLAGLAGCHRTLGLIAGNQDSPDEAIEHLEVALQLGELLRSHMTLSDSGLDRAGSFARFAYTNDRLIELLVNRGDAHRALEVAELAKARTFEDLLQSREKSAEGELRTEDFFPTLDESIDLVEEGTVAIEYYIGARGVFAFALVADREVTAHRLTGQDGLPLDAAAFIRRVVDLLAGMEGRAKKMIVEARTPNGFDKAWQDQFHQFYLDLIPPPVREPIATADHLVIIPHHILHYFPFAALVTQRDDQPRTRFQQPQPDFLIELVPDITTAPSLRAYAHLLENLSQVKKANAVGIAEFEGAPRLPGVEKDLQNYEEVFAGRIGQVLRTKPITEQKIASAMQDDALLFIGTHGMNQADRPLESFLLCDAERDSDGRLTAEELFQTEIECEAIILSACYSGLADRSPLPGDDLFGLQRAMLQAGASSIISGLWDVYDDTAPPLMKSTMAHFAGGETLRRSLASAQRDFLAQRKAKGPSDLWINPYFWAVYQCSGSGHTTLSQ